MNIQQHHQHIVQDNFADFTPGDLANLVMWLDSQDSNTITQSSNRVSQWNDKSASANNFTASGTDRPTVESGGINFDGANFMQSASQISLSGVYTVSVVVDVNTIVAGTRMYLGCSTTDEKFGTIAGTGNLLFRVFSDANQSQIFPFEQDQLGILTITRDSNNKVDLYVNGYPAIRLYLDAAQAGNTIFDRIGRDNGTSFWNGRINELIIDQSVANVSQILTYLGNKYNIALTDSTFTLSSPGNLVAILDDESDVTLDSNTVVQWNDRSGNSNHFVQATKTHQPELIANAFNGRRAVRFDGVDKFMTFGSGICSVLGTGAFSIYVLLKPLSEDTNEHGILRVNVTGGTVLKYLYINYDVPSSRPIYGLWYRTNTGGVDYPAAGRATQNVNTLYKLSQNGLNIDKTIRSPSEYSLDSKTNAGTSAAHSTGQFGRAASGFPQRYLHADVAAVVVYDKVLSNVEDFKVRQYLQYKFNYQ